MSPTNVEELLEVDQALQKLHISRTKLHALVRAGELPAVKFGRRTLFRAASLQAFIEAHETRAKPAAEVKGGRR